MHYLAFLFIILKKLAFFESNNSPFGEINSRRCKEIKSEIDLINNHKRNVQHRFQVFINIKFLLATF